MCAVEAERVVVQHEFEQGGECVAVGGFAGVCGVGHHGGGDRLDALGVRDVGVERGYVGGDDESGGRDA